MDVSTIHSYIYIVYKNLHLLSQKMHLCIVIYNTLSHLILLDFECFHTTRFTNKQYII